ncbi:MAG: response regulator transcription factor [Actinomycetota bacterium]|nr:response regulator transcription factor [Actinomycetota bacterium]
MSAPLTRLGPSAVPCDVAEDEPPVEVPGGTSDEDKEAFWHRRPIGTFPHTGEVPTLTNEPTAQPAALPGETLRAGQRAITVAIVDDHALFREGTVYVLEGEEGVEVVGEAGTGEDALELLERLRPDVAIVDINLPGMSGLQVARTLADAGSPVRVLIVSAYDDYAYVTEALEVGVAGYLLKTASGRELVDAVRAVADGVFVLDRAVSSRLARRNRVGAATSSDQLTPREVDVLALLAQGLSNKQIAQRLVLGLRTVESHVSNVLAKLGVTSRTEAVLYALEHHLVTGGTDRGADPRNSR